MMQQGCVHALTGHPSEAVQMLTAGITAYRSTGSNAWFPWFLSHLSRAYAELGQSDDAWRCIDEATAAVERASSLIKSGSVSTVEMARLIRAKKLSAREAR